MPTKITGRPQSPSLPLMTSSSTSEGLDLGSVIDAPGAEEYVWVKNGATAVVPGKLYQSSAPVANHQNLTCTAAAVGATQVTVTLGATAATENQYQNGKLIINAGTGAGQTLLIKYNPAAALSTAMVVTLEDPLLIALDGTSKACLTANKCNGVILNPATATDSSVGFGIYPIPAGEYGWLMKKGVVSGLADGAISAGAQISASNAVAGAVESGVAGQASIGRAKIAGVDTEYRPIEVML